MTKESGNLMTDQEKPSYLQKREKKILKNSMGPQGHVRQRQKDQQVTGITKEQERKNGAEKNISKYCG